MSGYRPGVLIGNWSEDASLEEERLRDFIQKRERGELLIQKIKKLQDNILKKIELSVSKDGFVHFGDTVMLLNPADQSSVENSAGACGSLTLAINLDEISIYSFESLRAPCGVSAAESADPVGRNTFCILSVDGSAVDEPVRFGQKFGLGTTGGFPDPMLYLASDHKSFIRFAKKSYLQQVFLTSERSYLTCWQAAFLDPQLRLESEGFPVPANSKIIITHCHTNRSLAIPRNFWTRKFEAETVIKRLPQSERNGDVTGDGKNVTGLYGLNGCIRAGSYFGKEYEVVCHTYLDSHKAEEDKNYWVIVTKNPGPEDGLMVDRPEPHPAGIAKKGSCEET